MGDIGSILDFVTVAALVAVCLAFIVALYIAVRAIKALDATGRGGFAAVQKSHQALIGRLGQVERLLDGSIDADFYAARDIMRRARWESDTGLREFEAQMRAAGHKPVLIDGPVIAVSTYSVGSDSLYVQALPEGGWRAFVAAPDNSIDALTAILDLGQRWLDAGGVAVLRTLARGDNAPP